jgi:uncharacterized protein YjbJ (UPF0337 family)
VAGRNLGRDSYHSDGEVWLTGVGGIRFTRFSSEPKPTINRRGFIMGAEDKAANKFDDLGGKAKEAVGKVTGDKDTENTGKADQAKSHLKDAGEKIKDAFKN